MSQILFFCTIAYFVLALIIMLVIWAALVVAKQDDALRGYDRLEAQ